MTQLKKSIIDYLKEVEEPKSTSDITSNVLTPTIYEDVLEELKSLKKEGEIQLIEEEKTNKTWRYWKLKS